MKKIRTLVIDDEPLARSRIINLLRQTDYITIVAEAKNGKEALKMIENYQPELIFLDIQMPYFNGFELLSKKDKQISPFVIFVTAYDKYAVKAFDVQAVDYLLKPFDNERFTQALEHARQSIVLQRNALLHKKMVTLLDEFQQEQSKALTFWEIKEKGRTYRVKVDDVYWLEAKGNYIQLHTLKGNYLLRETLQAIEQQLDKRLFLRIHRSYIVNTNYIKHIKYSGSNQYEVSFRNGDSVSSSRSYYEEICNYLKEQELSKR